MKLRQKQHAFERLCHQMRNIMKDFHFNVASVLCESINYIITQKFGSK